MFLKKPFYWLSKTSDWFLWTWCRAVVVGNIAASFCLVFWAQVYSTESKLGNTWQRIQNSKMFIPGLILESGSWLSHSLAIWPWQVSSSVPSSKCDHQCRVSFTRAGQVMTMHGGQDEQWAPGQVCGQSRGDAAGRERPWGQRKDSQEIVLGKTGWLVCAARRNLPGKSPLSTFCGGSWTMGLLVWFLRASSGRVSYLITCNTTMKCTRLSLAWLPRLVSIVTRASAPCLKGPICAFT